jgi:hypothetical protein
MSQIHRVILLNKPLKIFEFTISQLIFMFFAVVSAFITSSYVPQSWKLPNGLPVGFLIGVTIVCAAIAYVKMNEVRPWAWWRNLAYYRLNMMPRVYLPHPEPAAIYPDPTIIDVKKLEDEYYVE